MTVAVADVLLHGGSYMKSLKKWARCYPKAGYGRSFREWFKQDNDATNDRWGNGSAMRVSPIGWVCNTVEEVMQKAKDSALPSHAHPEGIKGAQAVALSVMMARQNAKKSEIKAMISRKFDYDLNRTLAQIRPGYHFSSWSQSSVPEAIICFLESESFVDAIQKAISLGGDADTQACIAGAIAEPYYGNLSGLEYVPEKYLPQFLMSTVSEFRRKYCQKP